MNKEIIILADGDFPSHPVPVALLNSGRPIICCDGAAQGLIKREILPVAIAGDMDSLPQKLQLEFSSIIHRSDDQESNDLTKAFMLALQYNPDKIIILGASGKREDHTLGNISLLSYYREITKTSIEMYSDSGIFIPIKEPSFFDFKPGTQISIFSLTPDIKITSYGLKYPTNNVVFDFWWKATLNEVCESPIKIEFSKGRVILFASYNE